MEKAKAKKLYQTTKEMKKIKQNFKYLLVVIGIVMVWRGIWGLADLYLTPDNQVLSFIISIFIGLILLLMNTKKFDIHELVE